MLFINLLKSNLNNQGGNFLKISNPKNKFLNIKKIINYSKEDRIRVLNNKNLCKLLFLALSPFFLFDFQSNFFSPRITSAFKYSEKNLHQKMTQIPVFAVTNGTGQPYLANTSNGDQIGLIFFSHEDALELLKNMKKNHQSLDARITIMGFDKAYKMVSSGNSSSGLKDNYGQDLKMIFKFYPDQKQMKNATGIINNINIFSKFRGIPLFYNESVKINRGNDEITPLFFSLEDFNYAWELMKVRNPDQPIKPIIKVIDLIEMLSLIDSGNIEFSKFGFFPNSKSLDFLNKERKINPSSRMIAGFFQKY